MISQIKSVEVNGDHVSITVRDKTILNKLRRALLSKSETYCIDDIVFIENTSRSCSESIAFRLNLIPIISGGEISLDIYEDKDIAVVSGDLSGCTPAYTDIIICFLQKGGRLSLKANLKKGSGEINAKWCPINICTIALDKLILETVYPMSHSNIDRMIEHSLNKIMEV